MTEQRRPPRPGRCRWPSLAGAVALAALAVVIPAWPAAAAPAVGNGQFGITPVPGSNGIAAPYFIMTVAAGRSAVDIAIISNPAGNGGSSFNSSFGGCSGSGCWVTGLPGTVTLPAGTGERQSFTVHVPASTAPGQYLAGITLESASPRSVQVGSNGKGAVARAVIIDQVTVGVAVNVGSLDQMTTRLQIPRSPGRPSASSPG